jgi:Mrp family chromosome partitioning ATPase
VRGKATFGEIIARDRASRGHLIAVGDTLGEGAEMLASERLSIALDALERTYDHVVLDFGALPDVADERLARLAPCVVVVASTPMDEAVKLAEESLRAAGCREVMTVTGALAAERVIEHESVAAA